MLDCDIKVAGAEKRGTDVCLFESMWGCFSWSKGGKGYFTTLRLDSSILYVGGRHRGQPIPRNSICLRRSNEPFSSQPHKLPELAHRNASAGKSRRAFRCYARYHHPMRSILPLEMYAVSHVGGRLLVNKPLPPPPKKTTGVFIRQGGSGCWPSWRPWLRL